MGKWISIDFGTSNSAAAITIDGAPKLVEPNYQQFFPTIACVPEKGNIVVGQSAENFRTTSPEYFLQEFKLNIDSPLDCNGADYRMVVAAMLRYIKGFAEIENNNEKIDNALLTIPAIYTENDKRKEVMHAAALDAGFLNIAFMREPEAAAYHYAYINGNKSAGLTLIYDLGGGTFDPSLIDMNDSDHPIVIGGEYGVKCGGQFFDAAIYKDAQRHATDNGAPLSREQRLTDFSTCRKLKEDLSAQQQMTTILSNGKTYTLTRTELEALIADRLSLTMDACDALLSSAKKTWKDLEMILLVGGSTTMPAVTDAIKRHLTQMDAEDVRIIRSMKGVNGDYDHKFAVCLGGISYIEQIDFMRAEKEKKNAQIGSVVCGDRICRLKDGINTFGRSTDRDFAFDDCHLSRKHFAIEVTHKEDGGYSYILTTMSETFPTVINGTNPLSLAYAFTSKSAELTDGDRITAGKTHFIFRDGTDE